MKTTITATLIAATLTLMGCATVPPETVDVAAARLGYRIERMETLRDVDYHCRVTLGYTAAQRWWRAWISKDPAFGQGRNFYVCPACYTSDGVIFSSHQTATMYEWEEISKILHGIRFDR